AATHATLGPDVQVVGVQAEGAAAYPASLAAGHPVPLRTMHTTADGIAIGRPGQAPLQSVREHVQLVDTVSDEDLSRARVVLAGRAMLVVEPAGAAGVVELMRRPGGWDGRVVAILTGGNVDPLVLLKVLRHGMSAAGRYLQFKGRVP